MPHSAQFSPEHFRTVEHGMGPDLARQVANDGVTGVHLRPSTSGKLGPGAYVAPGVPVQPGPEAEAAGYTPGKTVAQHYGDDILYGSLRGGPDSLQMYQNREEYSAALDEANRGGLFTRVADKFRRPERRRDAAPWSEKQARLRETLQKQGKAGVADLSNGEAVLFDPDDFVPRGARLSDRNPSSGWDDWDY